MSFQKIFFINKSRLNPRLFRHKAGPLFSGGAVFRKATVTTKTNASAQTYTASEILGGLILRDPNGGARADKVPTAANLIAAIPDPEVGDSFDFTIRNTADAAETITLTANTAMTMSGTMTIAQNNSKTFRVVITGVTSPAATVYSLGTVVT